MEDTDQSKKNLHDNTPASSSFENQGMVLSASTLEMPHQEPQSPDQDDKWNTKIDDGEGAPSMCSKSKILSLNRCQIAIFCIGLFMTLFSIAMLSGGYSAMFDAILKMEMEISEGSMSYKIWQKTPFPLIMKIYVWNITNYDAFEKGATPDLQECGPYVWKEYHEKRGIEFHENYTVTFLQERWWIWDEELSGNNSRDDVVFTLNPVPVAAAWSVRNIPGGNDGLNLMLNHLGAKAIVATTVGDLIFDGFNDPVLDWMQKEIIAENGTYHSFYHLFPSGLSSYERFGWFFSRNHSLYYDGIFNMMTGKDDITKVGQIDLWNYTSGTNFFDPPCNGVNGSAGEYFESDLQRDKIVFYSSDLCMSMTMFYKEDVEKLGVKAYRFWGSDETFTNQTVHPENKCFCVKGTCAPTGLINAESCRMGAPAFVSFPHYFNADPFLLEQVNGLSPNESKHAFIMDIMPEAGIPVNVRARMQINMKVTPYPGKGILQLGKISILKDLPDIYLPMIWFEELAEIPGYMSKGLVLLQFLMHTPTMMIVFGVLLGFGLAMMAYVLFKGYRLKRKL